MPTCSWNIQQAPSHLCSGRCRPIFNPWSRLIAAFVFVSSFSTEATKTDAQDTWPRFHGVDGQGIIEGQLPDRFDESAVRWDKPLGSRDVGSPVVDDGQVFLLRSIPSKQAIALDCLDFDTGNTVWSKSYPQSDYHTHRRNTLASSTPTLTDDHVFVAWSDGEHTMLVALDRKGHEIWKRDFGKWQSQHGFGTSPLVVGDLVVMLHSQQATSLEPGQTPAESHLIAVDRQSGKDVWRTKLYPTRTSYGIPAVLRNDQGVATHLIGSNTGNGIFAVDIESGNLRWQYPAFDKRCCSSPIIHGDLAIATCGSGGGGNQIVAVRIPQESDGTADEPEEAYRITSAAPYVPTSVVANDRLYSISDSGIASMFDAESGQLVKRSRLGGGFGASPILVGDELLFIDLNGKLTILSADDFSVRHKADLGMPVGATPAFAKGRLLIRVGDHLMCFES